MPTFEFDDGPGTVIFATTTATAVVHTLVENGVSFTFSTASPTPPTTVDVGLNYSPGGTGLVGLSNTDTPAIWLLDAQNPSGAMTDLSDGGFSGSVTVNANFNSGTWAMTFHRATAPNVVYTGLAGTQAVMASGNFSHITFTESGGMGGMQLQSLSATTINCFCAGTRIRTPESSVDVETLLPGDVIVTADGDTSTVKWLGRQPIDSQFSHPAKVNPICITAGALGGGLPLRDLMLSMDHAVAIGGYLINAGALVNGRTIYPIETMPKNGFTYYHVETEAHELLLAEGVAAETYLDYTDTGSFENSGDRQSTAPIPEMALVRISARRLVPEHIKRCLAPMVAAE
jgi:hypothetical protein